MHAVDLESLLGGVSPAIGEVRALITRLGPTMMPVLIQGPTGSGKELVAQALHAMSARPGSLVAVNSAAIADSMFEAEVFGFVKGAFSGALRDRAGFLAEADGGTLFLDEIGSLPLTAQPKLLRALDSGRFRPVGARTDRRSAFRLISAANEDLPHLVGEGRFRSDLLHRLAAAVIRVPELRQRREDIPVLAQRFVAEMAARGAPLHITDRAMRCLVAQDWPGNVRELRHVVERAAAFARNGRIDTETLELGPATRDATAASRLARDREALLLAEALRRHGWNVGRCADALGMHRVTLSRHLRRLGIRRPSGVERLLRENGLLLRLHAVEAPQNETATMQPVVRNESSDTGDSESPERSTM